MLLGVYLVVHGLRDTKEGLGAAFGQYDVEYWRRDGEDRGKDLNLALRLPHDKYDVPFSFDNDDLVGLSMVLIMDV